MIINGRRLYESPIACNGLLIVGDPHISSRRPGRRTDESWPSPILEKVEYCVKIANERNLLMVFLGDMFDTPVEEDEALKTRLINILKKAQIVPVSNTGNHDIRDSRLSDGDSLAMFGASDVLDVIASSGPVMEVQIGDKRIGIGMTPYGQEIPKSVEGLFPEADAVAWFTHHDIAFQKSYPGAQPGFEIEGCGLVINGHMHDVKENLRTGKTLWMNPGNINRQSIDLMNQKPTAWVFHGDRMEPIELPHKTDVFNLTGKFVEAIAVEDLHQEVESAFISLLEAETTTEMAMSADGSLLREEIQAKFERDDTSPVLRQLILEVLAEAVERRNAA